MTARVDWKKRALNAERREATAKRQRYLFRDRWRGRAKIAERQLRQLGPASKLAANPNALALARSVMARIKACDEKAGADGLCNCARYITTLLLNRGAP